MRRLLLISGMSILAGCDGATDAPTPPDFTQPTVAITSPAAGPVSGQVVLTVNASDDRGVALVRFLVNGGLVATDSAAPFSYTWDTSLYSSGIYDWIAQAKDAAGNVGISA